MGQTLLLGISASRKILPAWLTGLGSTPDFRNLAQNRTGPTDPTDPTGPTVCTSMGLLGVALHYSTCGARNPFPAASMHTQRADCTWSCGDMPSPTGQTSQSGPVFLEMLGMRMNDEKC